MEGYVPQELVGDWNGGPGDSSDFWIHFETDGAYAIWNDETGWSEAGIVVSTGQLLNFYPSDGQGSPWCTDWALVTS